MVMFLDNPRKISDTEDSEEDSTELQNAVRNLIADLQAIDERVKSLERDNNTLKQVASKRFKASMSAKKMSKKTRGKMSEGERDIESPIIRSSFGGIFFDFDEDEEDDDDGPLIRGLGHDTFSLLKVKPVLSLSWFFSLSIYALQTLLLMMIFIQQYNSGENSTPFGIPFKVEWSVRFGQCFALIVTVALSRDIFFPLRELSSLWINDEEEWLKVTGPIGEKNRYVIWFTRIFFPNLLQLLVGALNLLVSFIIIIQSDDVITLFADFAAMSVIAELDNIAFWFAEHGYFGDTIMADSEKVQKVKLEDKIIGIRLGRFCVFNLRMALLLVLFFITVSGFVPVAIMQISGRYFSMEYPGCNIPATDISSINDGVCDGGIQNSYACRFDGGDCLDFNIAYPTCDASEPEKVGDGNCEEEYKTPECKYDGGDCCEKYGDKNLGDGQCHAGFYHTAQCLYDSGDCDELRKDYPLCPDLPEEITDKDGNPIVIGDGLCLEKNKWNITAYMNEECGWVFGDCLDVKRIDIEKKEKYPNCSVTEHFRIGNGECDGKEYITEECGWDEFDCCNEDPSKIGDGICDGKNSNTNGTRSPYFTKECGYEGYDCCLFPEIKGNGICESLHVVQQKDCASYYGCPPIYLSKEEVTFNPECGWDGGDCEVPGYPECKVEVPRFIGDGICNAGDYNTEECGWDGGDCIDFNTKYPNCGARPGLIAKMGNGLCEEPELNTLECGWEDGDCIIFNAKYPDCTAEEPFRVGDGFCNFNNWGNQKYNNTECGWDGGDCIADSPKTQYEIDYPHCSVPDPTKIGNGRCRAEYNTAKCGWDGGDCIEFNIKINANFPNCTELPDPLKFGDGICNGGEYNTEKCGWDDGDCNDFNSKYPNCTYGTPNVVGDGTCDALANTEECSWDGGDCAVGGFPDCHVPMPRYIGDNECDGGEYNTEECGFDGGDCGYFNSNYPNCTYGTPNRVGDGTCDYLAYTEECGWDGGDCPQ